MASSAGSSRRFISFDLTEDQRALQNTAREFALKEMIPVERKYDESMEYPLDVFDKAWELGLVNSHIPEVRTESSRCQSATSITTLRLVRSLYHPCCARLIAGLWRTWIAFS